jgi:hypothetical protein
MKRLKHEIRADGIGNFKTVRLTPVKAIHYHCVECMGFSAREVHGCTAPYCALYPYRIGKRPKDIENSNKNP